MVLCLLAVSAFACSPPSSPIFILPQTPSPYPSVATPSPTPTLTTAPTSTPRPTATAYPTLIAQGTGQPSSGQGILLVNFIDVGQGDSILIQAPDGKTMLIDGGEANSGALQYLQSHGIKRLDLMVATHPHADHIGGLVQVLKAMPVAKVVTNGQMHTTVAYENFLDAIAAAKAPYAEVKRGDSLQLGSLSFSVLNPVTSAGDDLNNGSVVLRLVYGKVSFLFTGDAEAKAEASMLASSFSPVQANILKVGHHGSRSSSSPAFLALVKPQVAIYSAGKDNSYGHPHQEALAALAAVGAMVYGTDVNGAVVVTTDGGTYKIEAQTGQPRAPPGGNATPGSLAVPFVPPPALISPSTPPSSVTSGSLTLDILSVTSPVSPGSNATLTARTLPGASCTLVVHTKSGTSSAQGLYPKIADASGNVSWTWMVGTRTTLGDWRIVVTASKDGKSITKETTFKVGK